MNPSVVLSALEGTRRGSAGERRTHPSMPETGLVAGRVFARLMNRSHRRLTVWGLGHLPLRRNSVVLDVGCGGGHDPGADAARTEGEGLWNRLFGSARRCRPTNQCPLMGVERVDIQRGSVSRLPFAAEAFDAITAVETHYYWPDLEADLGEIRRVLRPKGRLGIIAEAYRGKRYGRADALAMRLLGAKLLSIESHRNAFMKAGFTDVAVFEEGQKGWLCVVGTKSSVVHPEVE